MKGKMWSVIKGMYESSRSAVLLEGEKSEVFNVEQGLPEDVVYLQFCFLCSLMVCWKQWSKLGLV